MSRTAILTNKPQTGLFYFNQLAKYPQYGRKKKALTVDAIRAISSKKNRTEVLQESLQVSSYTKNTEIKKENPSGLQPKGFLFFRRLVSPMETSTI